MEAAMDEEETQKNGIAIILDLGGLPMRLFKFLTPKATIISALKEEVTVTANSAHVTGFVILPLTKSSAHRTLQVIHRALSNKEI
jgi:hypothetical protein